MSMETTETLGVGVGVGMGGGEAEERAGGREGGGAKGSSDRKGPNKDPNKDQTDSTGPMDSEAYYLEVKPGGMTLWLYDPTTGRLVARQLGS